MRIQWPALAGKARTTMRLLLVEDDSDVARFVRRGLLEEAYAVDLTDSGEDALYQMSINSYDAVILDLMIPPPDGLEICRRLRAQGSTMPVLMLTARDAVEDKIIGLDSGADDYLAKPFEFRELLARVRALLRRGGSVQPTILEFEGLEIDTRAHRVRLDHKVIPLTTKEYMLLEFLARNSGRVVNREEIAEHVWDENFDPFSNLIEVYINRLRRNLEKTSQRKFIHTIRGAGYIFESRNNANGLA
jgi:two-component system copper resistance phosphate regulon response regulator CusR